MMRRNPLDIGTKLDGWLSDDDCRVQSFLEDFPGEVTSPRYDGNTVIGHSDLIESYDTRYKYVGTSDCWGVHKRVAADRRQLGESDYPPPVRQDWREQVLKTGGLCR